jgi:hypothetical protein
MTTLKHLNELGNAHSVTRLAKNPWTLMQSQHYKNDVATTHRSVTATEVKACSGTELEHRFNYWHCD